MDGASAGENDLLVRASQGDQQAFARLFSEHEPMLRQGIAWRLDRRVLVRVDVSDVLQETAMEAARRLAEYVRSPTLPLGLWLRRLARERVLMVHRRHLSAERRSVAREVTGLPVDSSAAFGRALMGKEPSPSRVLDEKEVAERLRSALGRLDEDECDMILWRHFEQLTNREIAQLLDISVAAAGKRYIRALERLRGLLVEVGLGCAGESSHG